MLEAHRRAVYRVHSQLGVQVGNRRMFYVVGRESGDEYVVRVVRCDPHAPKRQLPAMAADIEDVQYFTAKGLEIKPLSDACGRFDPAATTIMQHVSLTYPATAAA